MVRWTAAAVATAALVTVVSPVALVVTAWTGPQALAMGLRVAAPTYAVAGLAMVAGVALTVALLVTVAGVWLDRRRSPVTALILFGVTALVLLTPAWPAMTASWAPRWLALGGCAVAIVALASVAIADRRARGGSEDAEAAARFAGLAPAVAGLVGAYMAVAVVLGLVDTAIPQFPRLPWVPEYEAGAPPGGAIEMATPPQNPFLAPGEGATIHNDAWMTDAYTTRNITRPDTAQVRSLFAGGDCASILWDARGRLIAVCVSPTEVRAYVLDPRTLRPFTERHLADRPLVTNALTNFSGGGYAILDAEQRLVTPLPGARIARFSSDLDPVDAFALADRMQGDEEITATLPDWTGPLWFVGQRGTVGLLDPMTGRAASMVLTGADGGAVDIENSLAVAEGGGAYVVTSAALVRLDIVEGAPVVRWSQPYDSGSRRKPGQTSRASGTTPTVFHGGDYVAIADNAEPLANVMVIDVTGTAPRVHCTVPVFGGEGSATENSLIALGDDLIVENNYGYALLDVAGGRTSTPGLARIDVTTEGCRTRWETDAVTIPSLVSKGVAPDGTVLTYTKDFSLLGTDAWWFTAVDANTGQVRWRRLAGIGPLLNNHYAAGYVGPDGSVYVGTVSGVVAMVGD